MNGGAIARGSTSALPRRIKLDARSPISRADTSIPRGRYRTLHGFLCTSLLLVLLISCLHLLAPIEHTLFPGTGLSDTPFSSLTLILGLPHVVIGFLFSLTSTHTANSRGRRLILAAVCIGAILIWLSYLAGGTSKSAGWPMVFLVIYFLVHLYRDERHFYHRYGEQGSPSDGICIALLATSLYAVLFALAWTFVCLVGNPAFALRDIVDARQLASVSRTVLWMLPCLILLATAKLCVHAALERTQTSLLTLLRRDAPLWWVYALIPMVCGLAALRGGVLWSLVLLHVIGWWTFVTLTLAKRNRHASSRVRGAWNWVRATQGGFQLFHGALALAVCGLLLYYVHHTNHQRGSILDWVLTPSAFYYLTIMHVTVSFIPKGSPRASSFVAQPE